MKAVIFSNSIIKCKIFIKTKKETNIKYTIFKLFFLKSIIKKMNINKNI